LTGICLTRHITCVDGFTVVAEPTRRRILDHLRADAESLERDEHKSRGSDVGSLVNALNLPQPMVSKHLRVLREAGVVAVQVQGPRRVYSLAPQPLSDVTAWLEPYRQMWTESLDALERHLDSGRE
jgi:DNA-binding transcriptional ArsR family regulator